MDFETYLKNKCGFEHQATATQYFKRFKEICAEWDRYIEQSPSHRKRILDYEKNPSAKEAEDFKINIKDLIIKGKANNALKDLAINDRGRGSAVLSKYYKYILFLSVLAQQGIKGTTEAESENESSNKQSEDTNTPKEKWPHQIIFYGAPGTGKSSKIEEHLKNIDSVQQFRVTFHPEYSYSDFVGCYKPFFNSVDKRIEYHYSPGQFTCAYKYARENSAQNVYLIIEEINRGNCAAIFGDIFQLLDRDVNGESRYGINPDSDLQAELETKKMQLPKNLYIWATMNTSDQSLFPIDAAFKRRWSMEYVPNGKGIYYDNEILGYKYGEIIESINRSLRDLKLSDKEIGHYFLREDEIDSKGCVNKLIHYLYHDVYKVYGQPTTWFNEFGFDQLYDANGEINDGELKELLKKIVSHE